MTCLDGELKKAEPKTIRYRLLLVAATLVRRERRLILRLDETWPWAAALRRAFLPEFGASCRLPNRHKLLTCANSSSSGVCALRCRGETIHEL